MKQLLLVVTLCLSVNSSVNAADNAKQEKKVDAKCHVELYGGQQAIYFTTVQEKAINKLDKRLANRKITTVYSKEKQQVYQVFECVKLADNFSTLQARNLFAKYPR